jgi:hypothetical protein
MAPIQRKWILPSAITLTVVSACIFGLHSWHEYEMVAGILNLQDTPSSVANIQCDDPGFTTDILNTCAFVVDPADFPLLLSGWEFTPIESRFKRAHDFPSAYSQGPNFVVFQQYIAEPKDFSHGGMVFVFTDVERQHVLTHLYIE